jgi:site-specific DNA-methyltransferase (adenine-specific)
MPDNLTGAGTRGGETGQVWRGFDVTSKGRHWIRPPSELDKWDDEGLIYWPKKGGMPRFKRFVNEEGGLPLDNIWIDIPSISVHSSERLGYPTQKPLALLERIVKASSNPGDVVLDAFCGCGTSIVAAEFLDREWIGIDVSPTACRVMAKRLKDVCKLREGKDFVIRDLPKSEKQLREMPHFEFENWAVIALGGIPNKVQVGDMGIDGKIYPVSATPKGGLKAGDLDFMDAWYPIQVKQKDKVGRPDIDAFEAVMTRENRTKGFFVSFAFSADAMTEINSFFKKSGRSIIALTVKEILDEEIAMKLA